MDSLSGVQKFHNFLFSPTTLARTGLGKAAMVGLDVIFGMATLGTVHAGFGIAHLWSKLKSPPGHHRPFDLDKISQDLKEAQRQLQSAAISLPQAGEVRQFEIISHLHQQIMEKIGPIARDGRLPNSKEKSDLTALFTQLDQAWEQAGKPSTMLQPMVKKLREDQDKINEFRKQYHLT